MNEYLASPSQPVLVVLGLFVAGVLVKLVFFDLPSWELGEAMVYGGGYSWVDALMRLLDFGAIAAFFVLAFSRHGGALACTTRTKWLAGWRWDWRSCS